MKSTQTGVLKESDWYFSTPSETAKALLYYPISAGRFYCNQSYKVVRKNYDNFLIMHIISGSLSVSVNGRTFFAKKGETILIDCVLPHEYTADGSAQFVWVHFSGANSREMYNEITSTNGNLIKCCDEEYLKKLLLHIMDGINGESPASEFNLSLDIYKAFLELLSPMHSNAKNSVSHDEAMQEIKKYILEHLNTKITVEALAKEAHMSASHFHRVFKRYTGFSPYDYVLITRLNRAKEYLQKTNLSVFEIAFETGFNSEANFISFFTSNTGISPNKFRNLRF